MKRKRRYVFPILMIIISILIGNVILFKSEIKQATDSIIKEYVNGLLQKRMSQLKVSHTHPNYSWSDLSDTMFPPCQRPIVLKNAIDFSQISNNSKYLNCRSNDLCISLMKEKLIQYFGDELISVIAPEQRGDMTPKEKNQTSLFITTKEYLTNPKYSQHTVHTLCQLGTYEQYIELFGNNIDEFLTEQAKHNWLYLGTQSFISRGVGTGSSLHYAGGLNVFLMLSGQKRWMMIHPKYFKQFGCRQSGGGKYALCSEHSESYGHIDIDSQIYPILERNNISNNETELSYIDVILESGDILLSCSNWLHSIENLSPDTSGHSIRLVHLSEVHEPMKSLMKFLRYYEFDVTLRKFEFVWEFLTGGKGDDLTFFDVWWGLLTTQTDFINKDPRIKRRSLVNM